MHAVKSVRMRPFVYANLVIPAIPSLAATKSYQVRQNQFDLLSVEQKLIKQNNSQHLQYPMNRYNHVDQALVV